MKMIKIGISLLLLVAVAACSSSSTSDPGTAPKTDASTTTADPDGGPGSDAATALNVPAITEVTVMHPGLHVFWTPPEPECKTIELERKTKTVAYQVVHTVSGEASNKHDGTATEDTTYTYRLRCKNGATYSAYSNEKSSPP